MKTLRQTILNNYETCPYMCLKNWGEYGTPDRGNAEEYDSKYSACGIVLHKAMELWGSKKMQGIDIPLLELHDYLDAEFHLIPIELFKHGEEKAEFYNSLHEQLTWLYEQSRDIKPVFVEKEFVFENLIEDVPKVTGTMDRADGSIERKEVDLIDYKSGKVYTKRELTSNIQATLYSLAFYKEYGFLPTRFIFLFSKHRKVKIIYITPEFLTLGTTRIMNIWLHIKNGHFNPLDNNNKFFCRNFCNVVKECPKMKKKTGWADVGYERLDEYLNV